MTKRNFQLRFKKKSVAQEAIKIMKEELPIEVKADLDDLDAMDDDIYPPANKLILNEKGHEEPKLVMLQRFVQ